MKIHEQCKDWDLDYSNPSMRELDPESQEFKTLTSVLHLAGDVLASYNNLPDDVPDETKELILSTLTAIMLTTKEEVINCIDHALSMHIMQAPPEKGFTDEDIFGVDIAGEFRSILNEDQIVVAAEHYHNLLPQVDPGAEEDDDGEDQLH